MEIVLSALLCLSLSCSRKEKHAGLSFKVANVTRHVPLMGHFRRRRRCSLIAES